MLHLIYNDILHVFRDKTLIFFTFMPLLILAVVTWGVPAISAEYPVVKEYYVYIMMSAAMQTAIMYGFVYAFLFLEEKDEQVIQVIRVLPISNIAFLLSRLIFPTLMSMLGAFATIQISNLADPGLGVSLLLSFLFGLTAPLMILLVTVFANNKVEGMAVFKVINLLVLLPVLTFFLPVTKYILFLIPTYWTFQLYESSMIGGSIFMFYLLGILWFSVYLWGAYRLYHKNIMTLT